MINIQRINRTQWVLVLALITWVISGCDKDELLEKAPITELDAGKALQTEGDYIALTNSVYDVLQWQVINGAQTHMYPVMFQGMRADDLVSQWDAFWVAGAAFDDFTKITPSNPSVQALWTKWFTMIARANTAIHFVNQFEGFSNDELKQRLIAEAMFLRAFAYFELVKNFGKVPLITKYIESANEELKMERAEITVIYTQIGEDAMAAAEKLPESYTDQSDKGRATKGAAYTLLAKSFLYQEDYPKVKEYTEKVMSLGYALEENFADNWSLDNEYGKESIFEIGYADGFSNIAFEGPAAVTNQGSSSYQMFGYIFNGSATGFGNAVPRQELINLYEEGDARKDATFITPETVLPDLGAQSCGCLQYDENGNLLFGDAGNESQWVGTDIYNYFWRKPAALESKATMRKYHISSTTASSLLNVGSSPLNEKIFRYADVLLMRAEAAASGAGGDGQAALDAVRARAGLDPVPLTLENVKMERRKELATEGWDRFTDLVRWGDAADALAFKNYNDNRDRYLPIPQSEIDLVGESILTQNPGYQR
ncbi:RagB/SusD family nutrient uptake outer membrane protein [Fulvivirga ligni]|uniref:RagB/SusD family nutrient uptake outer membrane protein n=1 Tax=Fulvivirga ligni TaxID=2904246 RepID=UPI001F301399|nr:RagB/SusD family nutrient uptake outer membrane protein [Fulvivirga ligni]UII23854.1 RagB/SusD family nutrient uptake outer membrane protein [Fulvivirga ligni]